MSYARWILALVFNCSLRRCAYYQLSRFWTRFEPYIGLETRLAAAGALLSDQRGNRRRCYEGSQELVDSTSNIINGPGWEPVFADTFLFALAWENHEWTGQDDAHLRRPGWCRLSSQ